MTAEILAARPISYLEDEELATFESEDTFMNTMHVRTETDEWHCVDGVQLFGHPVEDVPIAVEEIMESLPNYKGDRASLTKTMSASGCGVVLSYINAYSKEQETLDIRGTIGYGCLLDCCGEQCRNMNDTSVKSLSRSRRAERITEGFRLGHTREKFVILKRDGKISGIFPDNHGIIPEYDLLKRTTDYLREKWPSLRMSIARYDHITTMAEFETENSEELVDILRSHGIDVQEASLAFQIVTSDVNYSAAKIVPQIRIDGIPYSTGAALLLTHKSGNTVDKWMEEVMPQCARFPQETEEMLNHLASIPIYNPANCLRMIVNDRAQMPRQFYQPYIDMLAAEFVGACTALDVYLKLGQMVHDVYEERLAQNTGGLALKEYISQMEIICRLTKEDYLAADRDIISK